MALDCFTFQTDEPIGSNEGPIRRNILASKGLINQLPDNINTMYDFIPFCSKKYGAKQALGSRKTLRVINEVKEIASEKGRPPIKKEWQLFELSPYDYLSYKDVEIIVNTLGSGLKACGFNAYDRFQIYARTSARWLLMAFAATSQSMVLTTAYDTLGEDGLIYALTQTKAKGIFTEADLVIKLENVLKNVDSVEIVIYSGQIIDSELKRMRETYPNVNFSSYETILNLGKEKPCEPRPPKPEDLACIMYTSGSTGTPKGVILRHKNLIASIAGINAEVGEVVSPADSVLCFLPLAHILEFVFETAAMYWGTTLGYANIKTLSKANVYNCQGDIQEFKPSIMVGVPAVWEVVRKGIMNQINNSVSFKKMLFWGAFWSKVGLKSYKLPGSSIIDALIFRKVRQATGGKLRYVLSGGAPLAESTRQFLSTTLCPVLLGYGLTETCAAASITHPNEYNNSTIGAPLPCLDMKLVDVPEAGYHASDPKKGIEQGEIYIRGDAVTEGYYLNDQENTDSFKDGWFRTGDIGEWAPNGHIRIIDRRKNIVKTSVGEYIALEKLEAIYRSNPLVNNICVYADQNQRKPIAIVVPVEATLKSFAVEQNLISENENNLATICENSKVIAAVWNQLIETGINNKLKGLELIEGIVLHPEEFTVESGLITSTQKLQRPKITERFKKDIVKAYRNES